MEIEKLQRRKVLFLERSPSPPSFPLSSSDGDSVFPLDPRPESPILPLPSTPPHLNHLPESNAKIMYMSAIGLLRVSDEEKQGDEIILFGIGFLAGTSIPKT